jgi:hypothetical protein
MNFLVKICLATCLAIFAWSEISVAIEMKQGQVGSLSSDWCPDYLPFGWVYDAKTGQAFGSGKFTCRLRECVPVGQIWKSRPVYAWKAKGATQSSQLATCCDNAVPLQTGAGMTCRLGR